MKFVTYIREQMMQEYGLDLKEFQNSPDKNAERGKAGKSKGPLAELHNLKAEHKDKVMKRH